MAGERTTPHDNELHRYYAGEALHGDDFRADEIRQSFEDDREGYANLGARNCEDYRYACHQLNTIHAFQHLGDKPFESESFDLITSFGVLHHIPNVTHVINECGRVLADNGVLSRMAVATDGVLCRLFRWNFRDHATAKWHKVRPTAVLFVLVKGPC